MISKIKIIKYFNNEIHNIEFLLLNLISKSLIKYNIYYQKLIETKKNKKQLLFLQVLDGSHHE